MYFTESYKFYVIGWQRVDFICIYFLMLIYRCYEFPPFGLNGMSVDEVRGSELQV